MATLPELRPNGDVSITGIIWTNAGGDTLFYQAVDDDPDSPVTTDYGENSADTAGTAVLDLTPTPSDFDSMDTIVIAGYFSKNGARVDDDVVYHIKVTNAAQTIDYVTEVQIAASDAGGDDTGLQTAGSVTASGQSASKSDWDGARIHVRVAPNKSKSWDSGTFRIDAVEIRGTYTEAGAAPVTVDLSAATLVSSPQTLDITTGAITVDVGDVTLASSPQTLFVDAPPPQTIGMVAATFVSSAQTMESVSSAPPVQSIPMNEITLVGSSQALDVVPGSVDVFMSDLTLVSAPQVLDVSQGPVSAWMGAATLVSSPQAMDSVSSVPPAQTVDLGTITLSGAAQTLDVIPGAATVSLGVATLASSPQALTISTVAPQTVDMSTATLVGTAQTLDIITGAITVPLGDVTLASSAQALSATIGVVNQIVNMQYATLASAGQGAGILPGEVFIQLLAISLDAESQTLSIATGIAPVTVEMAYASLASSALSFNLAVDQALNMGQVVLVAAPQDLIASAGPGSQTVYLDSVSAGLSLLSTGVLPGQVGPVLNAISLASGIQNLTLILGAPPNRILSMIAQSLASSALPASLIGGTLRLEVILRMSARCHTVYENSCVSTTVTKISSIALEEYEL